MPSTPPLANEGIGSNRNASSIEKRVVAAFPDPIRTVIAALNAREIRYVILRPFSSDASGFQELDILVDPGHRSEFASICHENTFYESRTNLALIGKRVFLHYTHGQLFALDVHYSVISKGYIYLDYRCLLDRRVQQDGTYYLSHEDQLLHLSFHCVLDKRCVPSRYARMLDDCRSSSAFDQSYVDQHLSKLGTASHFKSFMDRRPSLEECPDECDTLRDQVRRSLCKRNPGNLVRRLQMRVGRSINKLLGKRGATIAMVGPDGVGKSTLTEGLQQRIKDIRYSSAGIYMGPWGHSILPIAKLVRVMGAPGTQSSKLRFSIVAQIRWLFYLAILGVEFFARYVFRVVPATRKHAVVFMDRYFYDVGAGYKKRVLPGSQFARRIFCRLLPKPDLTLFLFADPAHISSRKDELDNTDAARFNDAYRSLAKEFEMLIVDCDKPAKEVRENLLETIWPILFCTRCVRRAYKKSVLKTSEKTEAPS